MNKTWPRKSVRTLHKYKVDEWMKASAKAHQGQPSFMCLGKENLSLYSTLLNKPKGGHDPSSPSCQRHLSLTLPLLLVTGTFLYVENWGLFGNDAHTSSSHDIYRFQRLNISFQNTTEESNPDITKSTAEGQRKMGNNAISQFLSKMGVLVNYFRILVNSISKYWVPPSLLLKGHGLSRGGLYQPLRTTV